MRVQCSLVMEEFQQESVERSPEGRQLTTPGSSLENIYITA